jgi:hypothetical protein
MGGGSEYHRPVSALETLRPSPLLFNRLPLRFTAAGHRPARPRSRIGLDGAYFS